MPGLAKMYDDLVRRPFQLVMDNVKLEGLTKLVANGYSTGITLVSPDLEKISQEEFRREWEEWNATHKGPYPTNVRLSTVWMAQKLLTKKGKSPRIIQAYTPIRFFMPMPVAEEETYGRLKKRIEKESMRAVKYVRGVGVKGKVNAFYIGNLDHDYIIPSSTKQCMPIAGDGFLDRIARDVLIHRVVFDLSLFEIE